MATSISTFTASDVVRILVGLVALGEPGIHEPYIWKGRLEDEPVLDMEEEAGRGAAVHLDEPEGLLVLQRCHCVTGGSRNGRGEGVN